MVLNPFYFFCVEQILIRRRCIHIDSKEAHCIKIVEILSDCSEETERVQESIRQLLPDAKVLKIHGKSYDLESW